MNSLLTLCMHSLLTFCMHSLLTFGRHSLLTDTHTQPVDRHPYTHSLLTFCMHGQPTERLPCTACWHSVCTASLLNDSYAQPVDILYSQPADRFPLPGSRRVPRTAVWQTPLHSSLILVRPSDRLPCNGVRQTLLHSCLTDSFAQPSERLP